uniref:AlNc14C11G1400 protein n=1 Tax=Albugo laibachii Nc14 TaxID=890382 RepID=F0W321_9STRA|nr:AlNc14C11G1400 [Albugo laibachii Nc14]|eukprot:CCA15458.1 AlNc14C11G1400 [Albugo laibachii Nc14]
MGPSPKSINQSKYDSIDCPINLCKPLIVHNNPLHRVWDEQTIEISPLSMAQILVVKEDMIINLVNTDLTLHTESDGNTNKQQPHPEHLSSSDAHTSMTRIYPAHRIPVRQKIVRSSLMHLIIMDMAKEQLALHHIV